MGADYGFFGNIPAADDDALDVFLGDAPEESAQTAFILNQVDPSTGEYDEHKILLGFASLEEAKAAYLASYDEGWNGIGSIASISIDGLKDWLLTGDKTGATSQETADEYTDDAAGIKRREGSVADGQRQSDTAQDAETEAQAKVAGSEVAQDSEQAEPVTDKTEDPLCPQCGVAYEWGGKSCNNCGCTEIPRYKDGRPGAVLVDAEHQPVQMLDAILLSSDFYHVVDSHGSVLDAASIPPKENGPLRVSLLGSLQGVVNANNRYFTPGFMRKVAARADAECKRLSVYGTEPHPALDTDSGQYKHKSEDEVWKHVGWHADKPGNLWTTVLVDEATPKGGRVGQKIRRGEKIGVSVRWTPYAWLIKRGSTNDGREVQYYDDDVAEKGFGVHCLDAVPNPAFPQAGVSMFDCEGHCSLPVMDSSSPQSPPLITLLTVTEVHPVEPAPEALGDAAKPCGCQHKPDTDSHDTDLPTLAAAHAAETAPPAKPPLDSEATAPPAAVAVTTHSTPASRGKDASPRGQEKTTPMVSPLTPEDIKKMSKSDRKAKMRSMLDALKSVEDADEKTVITGNIEALTDASDEPEIAAKTAPKEDPTMDAAAKAALDAQKAELDALKQTIAGAAAGFKAMQDADAARKEQEAAQSAVATFVSQVKAGTVDSLDLSRFDDDDRELLATAATGKASVADAQTAVETQMAIFDKKNAKAKLTAQGLADNGAKGTTVGDEARTETKVEVVADAADKAVAFVFDGLTAAMDKVRIERGLPVDPALREYNKKNILKDIKAKKNLDTPALHKAVADSALWLTSDKEGRKNIDLRGSKQTVVDAGLIAPVNDAAAVTNTSTLLNQASIAAFYLERAYQDLGATKYVSGISEGSMHDIAGGQSNIGQVLRIPSRYRSPAPHDYFMDPNSLVVGESQAIPKMSTSISYSDWPVVKRRIGMSLSKDAEMSILHGPLTNFDPIAYNMSEMVNEFQLSTDNYIYMTMSRASDEIGAKAVTSETVSTSNITYAAGGSVTQDGITYGANVTAAVQIAPGVNPGATRDSGLAGQSASADFMVPICMPRVTTVLGANGTLTNTVINPVSATIGGTPVVFGYLDNSKNIQSYVGTTATAGVDWAQGKILFKSGVNASTSNLVINYSAVTNITYTRATWGGSGYPNSLTASEYGNAYLLGFDQASARLADAPNFVVPDTLLTTVTGSVPIQNAAIFYNFLSPKGSEGGIYAPIPGIYAHRKGMDYMDENAPLPWGANTALIFKRGTVKYSVDTPFSIEGPFPSYDVTTGDLMDDNQWRSREFSIFAAPLARDQSQNYFNNPWTKHKLY